MVRVWQVRLKPDTTGSANRRIIAHHEEHEEHEEHEDTKSHKSFDCAAHADVRRKADTTEATQSRSKDIGSVRL